MLPGKPKGWEIPEREVTPEKVYLARRRFLGAAAMGLGSVTAAIGGAAKALAPISHQAISDAELQSHERSGLANPREEAWPSLVAARNSKYKVEDRPITPESITAHFNNYYEFTLKKQRVAELAADFQARAWRVEVRGHVEKPFQFDADDLRKKFSLEERVYRMRCVEAWSIVVPWIGFPMAKLVEWARPTPKAKFVRMVGVNRPSQCPGQREAAYYPWPYFEGLRLEEARNELALLVMGSYGHILPNQNGAPLRLITPWKYGYKSIKGITLFEFTDKQPPTFWNTLVPEEYDFLSNVNPAKPHPRWSQATEQDVASGRRIPTLPFNGYGEFVAHLYR
jgi:sulfoxide reductase catalytic subunit YedY